MYTYGYNFINSSDKIAVQFNSLCKYSTRELHAYKGLLRFKEIQDNFLFAEFEPNNDILELLTYHFKNRLRNEKFVIYDKKEISVQFMWTMIWHFTMYKIFSKKNLMKRKCSKIAG